MSFQKSGKIFRVQYKNALSDAKWTDLWPDLMADGSKGLISLPKDGPQRFYRIVLMTEQLVVGFAKHERDQPRG